MGRLPAHLVIVFFAALTLTVLCGLFLKFQESQASKNNVYLSERLTPDKAKRALNENDLRGVWVMGAENTLATLRLQNGIFELTARYKTDEFTRYFIRGGYRIDGNVIIMQERQDLGTPLDPAHFEYKFYPLSVKNINFYAEINGSVMIWQTPGHEQSRLDTPEDMTRLIFSDKTAWVKIAGTP